MTEKKKFISNNFELKKYVYYNYFDFPRIAPVSDKKYSY